MTQPMEDDEDFYGADQNVAPVQLAQISAITSTSTSNPSPTPHDQMTDNISNIPSVAPQAVPPSESLVDPSKNKGSRSFLSAADSIPTLQSSLLSGGSAQHTTVADSLAPAMTATAGAMHTSHQIVGQSESTSHDRGADAAQSSTQDEKLADGLAEQAASASDGAHGAVLAGAQPASTDVAMQDTTGSVPQIGEPGLTSSDISGQTGSITTATNVADTVMGEAAEPHSREPKIADEHAPAYGEDGEKNTQDVNIVDAESSLAGQRGNLLEVAHDTAEGGEGGAEFEADSSPYESSSEDSSDSSSDDDSDDDYPMMDAREQARLLMEEGGSDDEGGGKGRGGGHLRTQNEQVDEIVAMPDVTITEDMKIEELGKISTVVDNVALIKANTSGEYQVLEMSSLLCRQDRTVIGVVSETIGRVEEPMYIVRFTNAAALKDFGLELGTTIFYVPSHSKFLFTKALHGKGSDASNLHDEEVGENEMDFSDDEAEQAYKSSLKKAKQAKKAGNRSAADNNSQRGSGPYTRDYHSQSFDAGSGPTALSYDDDNAGDDMYTPLARPSNLADLMRENIPSQEQSHPGRSMNGNWRGGGSSGRGRGGREGDRGRGGRGRGRGRGDFPGRGRGQDRHQQGQAYPANSQNNHSMPQQQWGSSSNAPTAQNMYAGAQQPQPNPYAHMQQQSQSTSFQYQPYPVAAQFGTNNPVAMQGIQGMQGFPMMSPWPNQQQWAQQPNLQPGVQGGNQVSGQQFQTGGGFTNPQVYGPGPAGNHQGSGAANGDQGGYKY